MRLSEELRARTKRYASAIIRLYATLPISRKAVQVIGQQLLRSGTSVAAHTWPVKYNDDLRLRAPVWP
jgi:hypothetical protein